jgi:hypothetical protein
MEESLPFFLGAIVPVVVEAVRQIARWTQQSKSRRETEERAFYEAMESLDLKAIGHFLDRNIGDLDFETYAADPTVRRRVDTYIRRIAQATEPRT